MATHSSVLAWRIPGMEEPGKLPSLGSHRVGHDWNDLAAAAAVYICQCYSLSLSHPLHGKSVFFYFRIKCLQFVKTSKKVKFLFWVLRFSSHSVHVKSDPCGDPWKTFKKLWVLVVGRALSKRLKTGGRQGWRHWTYTVARRRHFLLLHQLHPDGSPSFF